MTGEVVGGETVTGETVGGEAAGGPKRRRRWPFAAAVLGLVLLALAVVFWQHERSRADRADRADVTARAEHDQAERQRSKAQTHLDGVDAINATERRVLDVDSVLKELDAVHARLRADLDRKIALHEQMIAAMPNADVTEYNHLVDLSNAGRKTTDDDVIAEGRLQLQLQQKSCPGCTQPAA